MRSRILYVTFFRVQRQVCNCLGRERPFRFKRKIKRFVRGECFFTTSTTNNIIIYYYVH